MKSAVVIDYNYTQHAIELYWAGESKRFDAAISAYYSDNKQSIAQGWRRSVSLVYKYSDVGELWPVMLSIYPSRAETWREDLGISFWFPIAAAWRAGSIDMAGVAHWLDEASINKWTVEELRTHLPVTRVGSEWKQSARKLITIAEDLISSPSFYVDDNDYRVARKLLQATVKWIKKIT